MSMKILVFVETRGDKLKKISTELLSEAQRIAQQDNGVVDAVLIGKGSGGSVGELANYGVSNAYVADHEGLSVYNVERFTAVIQEACQKAAPDVLLATANALGRDLFPRVAARLNTGMMTECVKFSVSEGKLKGTRPIYAGKVMVDVTIKEAKPQIATCRPNVFEIKETKGEVPTVTAIGAEAATYSTKARIKETVEGKGGQMDLTEASVIVAAGRAIKSEQNFKMIQDLADVLDGAIGASRAAVDAGYASHSIQVGQTGKTVNPKLYIACGISGAIQHLAGMTTSKVIVAINTDPQAPIFQKADYGIVADMFEVLPKLKDELSKLLAQ